MTNLALSFLSSDLETFLIILMLLDQASCFCSFLLHTLKLPRTRSSVSSQLVCVQIATLCQRLEQRPSWLSARWPGVRFAGASACVEDALGCPRRSRSYKYLLRTPQVCTLVLSSITGTARHIL
jgi:hypothetical protein